MIAVLEAETRSGGVRVRVDGQPFGTVSLADIGALGVVDGGEIGRPALAELARRAEVFAARHVALHMLGMRALPSRELTRRLVRKGHAREAATTAVAGLLADGVVDDAEFARHYARTRSRRRLGPARLVAELRRLGIGEREAEAAVADAIEREGVDTAAQLRETAARKAASLRSLDPEAARRRLRAYLLRRGYAAAQVSAVVKEALAG